MTGKPPLWTRDFSLICSIHLLLTLAFYATMPVLPLWLSENMRLSGFSIGMVTACYTGAAILARPFAGYCLDRYGRRVMYVPAYFAFALIFFAYPLAATALMVAVLRLAHGLAWGAVMSAANTAAADLIPPVRRGEGVGLFGLAMTTSMALGPSLGLFCTAWLGFGAPFIAGGIIALVGFLGLLCLRIPRISLNPRPLNLHTILEKTSLPVSAVLFLSCVPFGSVMNYTALYTKHVVPADAGLFFLIFAAGSALIRIVAGPAFDRSGPARIMVLSFCLLIAGYLSLAYFHTRTMFYISALVLGVGSGVSIPIAMAMINNMVPPQRRGAANATVLCSLDLGVCCGILLTGHTHDAYGWEVAFLLLSLCMIAAALLFFFRALPHYTRNQCAPDVITIGK